MFVLALIASALAHPAHAAPLLQPAEGEKSCLVREYSPAHLDANPKQFLSKIHVLLSNEKVKLEEGTDFNYYNAKVVGEKEGKLYGNEATCEKRPDGAAHCFIDCDGGSFELRHARAPKRGFYFEVTPDYYFPLFRQGADPENASEADTLSLSAKDSPNRLYRLEAEKPAVCEERWREFKEVPAFGC